MEMSTENLRFLRIIHTYEDFPQIGYEVEIKNDLGWNRVEYHKPEITKEENYSNLVIVIAKNPTDSLLKLAKERGWEEPPTEIFTDVVRWSGLNWIRDDTSCFHGDVLVWKPLPTLDFQTLTIS